MRTRRKLPPQVLLLGFIALLNDSASEMIYPLLPVFLTTTLGATPMIVGVIEGAADGLASILKLVAGAWSDRVRRRKPLIVAGYALAAGSRALIANAGTWTTVLAARLIDRTGKGIRSAPRDALIADVAADQRGRAFGFHRALDHTGAVVGPLIAIGLLNFFTLRQMFLLAVVPGAIGVLLLLFFLKEDHSARDEAGPAPESGPLPPRFWRLMVAIGLFALANSSDAFLILRAHEAGVSVAALPLLWSAHHVVKAALSTHAGALSDRVGRRGLLAAAWSIYALIYLWFPAVESVAVFLALFVAYAIPFALSEGAERALIGDLVAAGQRGRGYGVYYLINGMGVLAGSVLFGLLYQEFSPRTAFAVGATFALAAAVTITLRSR